MTAASATDAGYLTTGTQTLAGDKTLTGTLILSGTMISTATLTDPGNSVQRRIQATHTMNFTSAAYTGAYTGYLAGPSITSANTQSWTNAGNSVNNGGLAGFTWNPQINGASGTMALTGGFMSSYNINMAVTTVRQFHAKNPAGAGVITNLVAYHAEQQTRGTNSAGFVYGTQSTGTYGFYNSTADPNHFGTGRTTIGSLTIITAPEYADNAAALAAGLTAGQVYRTATGALHTVF